MSAAVALDALDLAALLCSRVCHDVISPTGAIVNGLEVLEEQERTKRRTFALDLIKKSARRHPRAFNSRGLHSGRRGRQARSWTSATRKT